MARRRGERTQCAPRWWPFLPLTGVMWLVLRGVLPAEPYAQLPARTDSGRTVVLVGADLRGYEWPSEPPLVRAAAAGDTAQVQALLATGADPNHAAQSEPLPQPLPAPDERAPAESPSPPRRSPILAAAQGGHVAVLAVLAEAGADIAADSAVALEAALEQGHAPVVQWLVQRGVPLTGVPLPALAIAAIQDDPGAVQILLAKGAPVDAPDTKGRTPLMWAAAAGARAAVAALLAAGADPNGRDGRYQGCNVPQDRCGIEGGRRSPLAWAARYGQAPAVRQLLAAGADPSQRDAYGDTPLHYAAFHGHREVVQALLDGGAAPDDPGSLYARTPFFLAVRAGQVECVRQLREAGATIQADALGRTPLMEALHFGHSAVVDLLLESQDDMRQADQTGEAAVHIAAASGREDLVQRVLDAGADPNQLTAHGWSPLLIAAGQANAATAQALLAAGADPNLAGEGGRTPLMQAASVGNVAVVHALLRAGASAGARDDRGWSALDYATFRGDTAVARLLQ